MNIPEHPTKEVLLGAFLLEELSDHAVFLLDLELRVTTWSQSVSRILGYSESEFLGLHASVLFTPEDRKEGVDEKEFEHARVSGRASDTRWHMKKDGSRIFLDGVLKALSDGSGAHFGYAKLIRDISPNRLADSMLVTILDRTPDAISLKDREGRFAFVNSEIGRLTGRHVEDLVGLTSEDLFPPHISAALRESDVASMQADGPTIVEERMMSKQGGELTFLSGKAPWRDNDGNVIGVVSIAQDISARKRAEEERERLLREVQKVNDQLSDFSHSVSHDLQTPLRMVRSYTELLAQANAGKLDTTADQFISFILSGAAAMDRLVKALLEYAQTGQQSLTRSAVATEAVVVEACSSLKSYIDESHAEVTCGPLPVVTANPVQLVQLFQNLIGNSIKYARPGVPPRICVTAAAIESGHMFTIQDNGIGIDRKHFERVFSPLKRLHGQEIPGTGLGLAICKKIVESNGGQIWLSSEPENGSTFYFTIPAGN